MKHPIKALPLRACARLTLSALALSAASSSLAETSETFDTMTVTANRMPTVNSLAPTTVITRADIERLQTQDLPNLLSRYTAIDLTTRGGFGKDSSIFMRGTNSDHVLFLVDGVKWFSATSGAAAIQDFPVSQIERIEIVRGPRSGIYGSEAIGGVIQIFTRQGSEGVKPYVSASIGSHNTQEATVGVSGGDEDTRFNVSVNHLTTNGIDAREDNNPDHDGYRNKSVAAKVKHQVTNNWSVGANFLRAEADNEYDGFFSTNDYTADTVQQVMGLHSDLQLTQDWLLQVNVSESRDQLDDFVNNVPNGTFNTRHRLVSVNSLFDIAEGHRLNVGIDYDHDKVVSDNDYSEKSRDNKAAYLSWQANVNQHDWLLSARHDDNEAFGHENTGNAEYGYWVNDELRLGVNAGTAFKTPTFNDLYWPDQIFFVGNPNLKPEKAKTFGASIQGQPAWGNWSLHGYYTKVRELIVFQNATMENVDEARIKGLEFDLATTLLGWQVQFNAAILKPENADDGHILARRAKRMANLHLDKQFGDWSMGASWKVSGHRFDDPANDTRLGGYGLVDLRLAYQVDKDWSVKLNASNIFDKDYQTVDTYNNLDTTVTLTVSYQP